jgi:hypothetical protein
MANNDEPESVRRLVSVLLDLLEASLHNLDSAVQVAMRVPDWKRIYMEALEDELLAEKSKDAIMPVRCSADAILDGREAGKELDEALEKLRRRPN